MKNILIITDSLGIPRKYPEYINETKIWCYKLQQTRQDNIYCLPIPNLDTNHLQSMAELYLSAYQVDIVIIQVGIVDCAPRVLTKNEVKLISRLKILSKIIKPFIKKHRNWLIKKRKITYTTRENFRKNIQKILAALTTSQTYFIPIAPSSQGFENYNNGVSVNISEYNKIIKNEANIINVYDLEDTEKIFMSDHHHLNECGHKQVFVKVNSFLNSL